MNTALFEQNISNAVGMKHYLDLVQNVVFFKIKSKKDIALSGSVPILRLNGRRRLAHWSPI